MQYAFARDLQRQGSIAHRSSFRTGAFSHTARANTGEPTVMNGKVWMHEDLFAQFPSRPKDSCADPLQYFGPLLTAT